MKETYEVGPGRTMVVTIEVTGTGAEVTEFAETRLPSRNLYTDDELAQAIGRESDPLRRRIAELERALAASVKRETDLEVRAEDFDRDRHTERNRADRERQRASELKDRLSSSEERVQEECIRGNNLAERLAKAEKRAEKAESKLMEGHVCTGGCSGDQHVAFVGRKALAEMENQVAELTRRIDNTRVILSDARVVEARNKSVTALETVLGGAVEKALDTLA